MTGTEHLLRHWEIDETCEQLVGGKAMGLSRLLRGGFEVPPFFVLTCEAWTQFCAPAVSEFRSQLDRLGDFCDAELHDLSSRITRRVLGLKLGTKTSSKVRDAIEEFRFQAVAVRSSALAEDLPGQSFSGIYESFIDIPPDHVPEMVPKCWASAFSVRAIKYRWSPDIVSFAMATIIQQMEHFDLAGVAFTVDPVGKRLVLVEIAAIPTPEPIVSGKISPGRVSFDRQLDLVEQSNLGQIRISTVRHVAELALKVEQNFGSPQDIEFGVRDGQVIFLQSRPITTLNLHKE